ncbi:hypothetical protein GF367_01920 [Candidatus Woesearchaeota archaeon]|nr:hypothetical protein [Candidatus Woesearchaeota archaeon]
MDFQLKGSKNINPQNLGLGKDFFLNNGLIEPPVIRQIKKTFQKSNLFFDVGASVGYYSALASAMHITCTLFEPRKKRVQKAKENLKLNGSPQESKVLTVEIDGQNNTLDSFAKKIRSSRCHQDGHPRF